MAAVFSINYQLVANEDTSEVEEFDQELEDITELRINPDVKSFAEEHPVISKIFANYYVREYGMRALDFGSYLKDSATSRIQRIFGSLKSIYYRV